MHFAHAGMTILWPELAALSPGRNVAQRGTVVGAGPRHLSWREREALYSAAFRARTLRAVASRGSTPDLIEGVAEL